jgi:hypothetical protein
MVYRTPLAKLLLEQSPEVAGSPLFKSQAELAKLIVSLSDSDYKEESNLRSFLNQVLSGSRRCNEKLTQCIISAASSKFVSSKQQAKVREIILQGIQTHNDTTVRQHHSRFPTEVTRGEVYEKMVSIQSKAERVFIINMRPLELVPKSGDQKQRDLTQETMAALLAGKRHVFCVPDRPTAILLWRAFYEELETSKRKRDEDADSTLTKFEDEGTLTIYKITSRDCIHSTVVYNAGSPERASGWIWYVPWDPNECAEMPREVLENWTREYFNPITAEQLDNQERVRWTEAKKTA